MKQYKKNLGGCHHLLFIYNAPKLSYVVKSPVLGLQRAFFDMDTILSAKIKTFLKMLFVKKIGIN